MVAGKRLAVIGQGYVGLPLALRAAEVGFVTTGIDTDARRIAMLAAGQSFTPDVTSDMLRAGLTSGRYTACSTNDGAANFDVAVITVPTPLADGLPDLSMIEAAANGLAPHLRRGATVILESTTYPGTTDELVAPILERGSGFVAGSDFCLGYSPERLDPGNRRWTLRNTPKVVSGIDVASCQAVEAFYAQLVDTTVPVSSCRVAELTKLLENTFRHVNVALVNELAVFAHELGLDLWEAIDAAATKPFGYMRFTPGPGVGGHCLPIDPSYLSWKVKRSLGHNFRFVELANDINDHMPDYVVRRATALLNGQTKSLNGSRLLLVGLAYKQNTGDTRGSPAIRVAELLHSGGAEVRAVDPRVERYAVPAAIALVDLTSDEARSADLILLLTDHDDLVSLLDQLTFDTPILDTRHRLRRDRRVYSL